MTEDAIVEGCPACGKWRKLTTEQKVCDARRCNDNNGATRT